MSNLDLGGLVLTIVVVAVPFGVFTFWLGYRIGSRKPTNMRWSGDDEA